MLQLAEEAGSPLDSRRAWDALGFVRPERIFSIRMLFEGIAEANSVFHRLTGPLRDVLQHRMGSVAEQRDPSARPRRNRQPIEHRPSPVAPDETNRFPDDGAQRCEG